MFYNLKAAKTVAVNRTVVSAMIEQAAAVNSSVVSDMIQSALNIYHADGIGAVDYALASLGSVIVPWMSSYETIHPQSFWSSITPAFMAGKPVVEEILNANVQV